MTTVADVMLNVAKLVDYSLVEGTTSALGSTTTAIDTTLVKDPGSFKGGTLWILSGTYDGSCKVVSSFGEGTFTFTPALVGAVAASVSYAVCNSPLIHLRRAVQQALYEKQVMLLDDTLTVVLDQEEYTLPTGVSDVRRVQVAQNSAAPYAYKSNYAWREQGGKLYFDAGDYPTETAGYKIRIYYAGYHPEVDIDGAVNSMIDLNWLKWAGALNFLRREVQELRKDNPINSEMMNEAINREDALRKAAQRATVRLMDRDPRYTGY